MRGGPLRIGYARVSTQGRSADLQVDALREVLCEEIFVEKASGRAFSDRTRRTQGNGGTVTRARNAGPDEHDRPGFTRNERRSRKPAIVETRSTLRRGA